MRHPLRVIAAAGAVALLAGCGTTAVSTSNPSRSPAPPTATPTTLSTPPADPIASLPQGAPTTIPVLRDGTLSVGGTALAQQVELALSAGRPRTIVVVRGADADPTRAISVMGTDGAEHPLATLLNGNGNGDGRGGGDVVLSPDGRLVAGLSEEARGVRISEWVATGTLIGSTLIGEPATLSLNGIDDAGRVYVTTYAPRAGFTWQPGTGKVTDTSAATDLAAVGFGAVGPHGVVDLTVCDGPTWSVSPDGSQVLCQVHRQPGAALVSVATGTVTPLRLPRRPRQVLGFETDQDVLVIAREDGRSWLLHCAVSDGACQRVTAAAKGTSFATIS